MSKSESPRRLNSVLVVDDSIFMRHMLSDMINEMDDFAVVGVAGDGEEALRSIARLDPDIITLDIAMPKLDGFGVLERVMSSRPRPIVVVSAYTADDSEAALRALELGAVDLVPKPSGPVSLDLVRVRERLRNALEAAAISTPTPALPAAPPPPRTAPAPPPGETVAIAIAASTGGPRALRFLLGALPFPVGATVFIVQHMPPGFTTALATRLDGMVEAPVREAQGGERVGPDQVWLAPGDRHMRVRRVNGRVEIAIDEGAAICGTRPAADALFPSVAEVYASRSIGVVLTGMGRDGTAGLAAIRAAGGRTLAQDRETSVVFGMPARAVEAGAAERALPLRDLPAAILDCLASRSRGGSPAP